MEMILRFMGDAATSSIPVLSLESENHYAPTVVFFPGIEGVMHVLEPLYKNVVANIVGLQYPNSTQKDTIKGMAAVCLPVIYFKL